MRPTAPSREPTSVTAGRQRLDGADFEPAGFFLLRTPLLPFDELASWGQELRAPGAEEDRTGLSEALDADRRRLRGWLHDLLQRPEVVEALHLASPGLLAALEYWRRNPDDKKGRRAEEALVRYAVRMTARSTPFGLFAGCTIGRIGENTGGPGRLRLGDASNDRRHSRLDMDYLVSLAHELDRDPELRRTLRYRPNTSIYRAAGRLRYAESRLDGDHLTYHLVAVEPNEFLDVALERAAGGASVHEIAAAVAAADPDGEITLEDAEEFVDSLVDGQLLVSELWPPVTGAEGTDALIATLESRGHGAAAALGRAREALQALDREGRGHGTKRYREIARGLDALPKSSDTRHLFQVDLLKAGEAVLDPAVADEIARGIEVLHRLSGADQMDPLEGFRDRFLGRYEQGRLVPLVEVLDDEAGIGLPSERGNADASPLLEGLDFSVDGDGPAGAGPERTAWGPREEMLLEKLTRSLARSGEPIEITEEDLRRLEPGERPPLPDSFQAMAKLSARSDEALAAGDFEVWVKSVFGPSGARIAGRFCHADPELAELVREHLRAEEALDPDALFAEVVHLPNGRVGNVVARPLLRDWEIPFLGTSGAPAEHQIPVDDLLVTVAGSEVILVSARHGRRVIPRLTSAHNFVFGSLGVYRFLCSLQAQGVRTGLTWSWGPLEDLPYLPRVCCGRVVLSRARWRLTEAEIADLARRRGAERYRAARRWREERGIPRRVLLADEDIELFVDFDNVLCLDALLPVIQGRDDVFLTEVWPEPANLPVRGPGGRFAHELMIPFERRREPRRRRPLALSTPPTGTVERTLPPTSDWLYLKLFTGPATADLVLRDQVAPLVDEALGTGAAERWFFLRYGEPDWHLRVRFGGEAERLRSVVDLAGRHLEPALREGRVWRWQLDTYEREVERYGGPRGVEIAERIFHADSDAVLATLAELEGDHGAEERWRLAFVGIDRLMADFHLDLEARRDLLETMRDGFAAELGAGARLRDQLAARLRQVRGELAGLLSAEAAAPADPEHPLAGGLAALALRSERLAPLVAELESLEAQGELSVPVAELVPSFAHMFVNRLIRSDQRAHELVLYDFLHRITLSRLARGEARGGSTRREPGPRRARSG